MDTPSYALCALPAELWAVILSFHSPGELMQNYATWRRVSSQWRRFVDRDDMWLSRLHSLVAAYRGSGRQLDSGDSAALGAASYLRVIVASQTSKGCCRGGSRPVDVWKSARFAFLHALLGEGLQRCAVCCKPRHAWNVPFVRLCTAVGFPIRRCVHDGESGTVEQTRKRRRGAEAIPSSHAKEHHHDAASFPFEGCYMCCWCTQLIFDDNPISTAQAASPFRIQVEMDHGGRRRDLTPKPAGLLMCQRMKQQTSTLQRFLHTSPCETGYSGWGPSTATACRGGGEESLATRSDGVGAVADGPRGDMNKTTFLSI